MCSSISACSSSAWSPSSSEISSSRARPRHLLEGERAGHDEPEDDRGDQVEGDGRRRRDDQDRRIAAGRAQERAQARDLDHLDGRREQDAGEGRERDPGDPLRRDQDDEQQRQRTG